MKRSPRIFIGAMLSVIGLLTAAGTGWSLDVADYETGKVIVYLRDGAVALPAGKARASLAAVTVKSKALQNALAAAKVSELEVIGSAWHDVEPGSGMVDFKNFFALAVPGDADIPAVAGELMAQPDVLHAQPHFYYETFSPNDPLYPDQWHLENTGGSYLGLPDVDLDVETAWALAGSNRVDVWVLDTGIASHADIDGHNEGVCAGSWQVTSIHGTAVAGLISARQDNGVGVAGVGTNVHSVGIKLGDTSPENPVCGLDWASGADARIVNNSWGGFTYDAVLGAAVRNLYLGGTRGCLVVSAMGNFCSHWDGCDSTFVSRPKSNDCARLVYPAAFTKTSMAVGGVVAGGRIYFGSSIGPHIDVSAPGGAEITTTTLYGGYTSEFGGTSASAPIASGVAALLLQTNPALYPMDLERILERTAIDMGDAGFDDLFGHGRIHAGRALRFITAPRIVEHGVIDAANVSVTGTSTMYPKKFKNLGLVMNDPSLPNELTDFQVERLTLEGTATFTGGSLTDGRNTWVRPENGLSPGWENLPTIDAIMEVGWGQLDSWTATSATYSSYTYRLYDAAGTTFLGYVPVDPAVAAMPYTAVLGDFDDPPAVTVTQPDGGENWRRIGTRNVTWTATDDSGVDDVAIYWSLNQGIDWQHVLTTGELNDGVWTWAIGDETVNSRCSMIAVVANDTDGDGNYDMSDDVFIVKDGPTSVEFANEGTNRGGGTISSWVEPRATIGFNLPTAQSVSLDIFDLRGRRVRTLVSEVTAAGEHRIQWDLNSDDGRSAAKGIYLYRFETGAHRSTGKILVIR